MELVLTEHIRDIVNRGNGTKSSNLPLQSGMILLRKSRKCFGTNSQDAIIVSQQKPFFHHFQKGAPTMPMLLLEQLLTTYPQCTIRQECTSSARSGPACLAAGVGDCDEQTNAFFSILRTNILMVCIWRFN